MLSCTASCQRAGWAVVSIAQAESTAACGITPTRTSVLPSLQVKALCATCALGWPCANARRAYSSSLSAKRGEMSAHRAAYSVVRAYKARRGLSDATLQVQSSMLQVQASRCVCQQGAAFAAMSWRSREQTLA
eukprot:scaffold12455_cov62-Phaeocystis_antarctica.AAC.10